MPKGSKNQKTLLQNLTTFYQKLRYFFMFHGIPDDTPLKDGDILNIDTTVSNLDTREAHHTPTVCRNFIKRSSLGHGEFWVFSLHLFY